MTKNLIVLSSVVLLSVLAISAASAAGEDVFARTGQYTFFIKPYPGDCVTYYQKMVPCVAEDCIQVPKRVFQTYQVPVPVKKRVPLLITETPVGCAEGAGPCVTCNPRPSCRSGYKEMWGPKMVTVRVPDYEFTTKKITRRVMLPQWFAVTEQPKPPQKIRKVH